MSIVPISFDIDTSKALSQAQVVKGQAAQAQQSIDQQRIKVMSYWTYFNQLASMSLNMLGKAAEGTAAQSKIAGIIGGLQIAQAEVAIYQALLQASAFAVTPGGQIKAGMLYAIAALMQANVIKMSITRAQQSTAQRQAELMRREIESYGMY